MAFGAGKRSGKSIKRDLRKSKAGAPKGPGGRMSGLGSVRKRYRAGGVVPKPSIRGRKKKPLVTIPTQRRSGNR